jgi:hypothetical protein
MVERAKRAQKLPPVKTKLTLATLLLLSLPACQTQPKLPDPFDLALEAAIVKMFDTEGSPKP